MPALAVAEAGGWAAEAIADATSPDVDSSVATCAASTKRRFEEACTRDVPSSLTETRRHQIKRPTVEPSPGWPPGQTALRILADAGWVESAAQQEDILPTEEVIASATWRVADWVHWCEQRLGVHVDWRDLVVRDKVGTTSGSIRTMTSRLSLDAIRERILPVARLCPSDASAPVGAGER